MKRNFLFLFCFLIICAALYGCGKKNSGEEYTAIKDIGKTNEKEEGANEEYAKAYNALLSFADNLKNIENIKDKKNTAVQFMYFIMPVAYDSYNSIDKMSYEDFIEMSVKAVENNGGSQVSAREQIKNNSSFFKDKYIELKNKNASQVSDLFDNEAVGLFSGDLGKVQISESTALNDDELKKINDSLNAFIDEKGRAYFELIGIDTKKYITEKGYKAKLITEKGEKFISFYYMDGDWRIFPEV